jgi:RIP homotypic interaction motif
MSAFRSMLKDTVFIVKSTGSRLGPYKAAVTPSSIIIMESSIDADEGDHVAREIPSGKEEMYLILSADFSQGLRSIPPSYTLKVRKTTALSPIAPSFKSTTINIHNSTGVQVGDYNTQQIQATFNELVEKINQSSASITEKTEAKSLLVAFLAHPLVTSVLGGAAGAVLGTLSGG